ncbi:unnamed protein product [Hermetia illucens]|uniref:Conserved oligomeric Golgi complex subunit 2 n=1 Tax=Hermetia illucens TaxID=343691 RepID=A0A7R8V4P1_HERIL|nr:conserved oligomeric Golgi complex subunit 2 [Hermetia illucens]CAD7092100.1 unnamed protein product [Hermetia illucens]
MPKSSDLFSLPAAPPELCFDKNEFMKKTFSVDDFLHEHRNAASLEIMRDDLGIYLKVLRSAMIELINEDYADFVNLSTNLVGLDHQINTIHTPVEQLGDEVLGVKQVITDTMNEIKECLNQKKLLRQYKKNLKSLAKVYNSINKLTDLLGNQLSTEDIRPVVLERAALELVQLQFHVKFCSEYLDKAQAEKTESLHKDLLGKLREYFLKALKMDADSLERCLRIYATLDEYKAAETVFREDVVGTYMNTRISESKLQNSSQGLVGIYNQILDFISLHMKDLLLLTHHTDKVKGFNFLVNSFWQEVERRLELNLASIFAPGNPDSFYVKYKSTLDFLANVEKMLGTQKAIDEFRQHAQYKSFQSRWNLPVYFQIRFQEIAGRLENVCDQPLTESTFNFKAKDLKCVIFQTALSCITKLWEDGVYIEDLFSKFWKLTLQIISRTARWMGDAMKEIEKPTSTPAGEQKLDRNLFLVVLHMDAQVLMDQFPTILQTATEKAPQQVREHISSLEKCIEESRNRLLKQMSSIEDVLIKSIITKSSVHIRQTNDIPRLYRKTNRDVPRKHCSYVDLMLEPFKVFKKDFHEQIGNEKIRQLFTTAFSKISVQYFKAIEEVLTSVQKTEESLRRLKNLREKSTSTTTANIQSSNDRQGMSDDDKIRLQLQIDVRYWTKEIESNDIRRENVDKLFEMISLVEDTTKANKTSDK